MSEFRPVTTLEDLATLNGDEGVAGYFSFEPGDSEPGNNHSRSFWHGWRNAAMDRNAIPPDRAAIELARLFVARCRAYSETGGVQ